VVVWLIASGLFAFYVANFANYNKTYGSIAGVIIFLVWLWISNIAILFGAEFNAELERGRAAAGGDVPLGDEPYVEPRDMRKICKRRRACEVWVRERIERASSCARGAHPWQADAPVGGGPDHWRRFRTSDSW
jgi:Virulence factor BrkB